MKVRTRYIADIIIGIMTATSSIWVDVGIVHRILIAVLVTLAVETALVWLDGFFEEKDNQKIINFELERLQRNRDRIYEQIRKMP